MFLGGNTTIPQGGAEVYTLDRAELGLIAGAKGDGYYKDPSYWREVLVTFQKSGGFTGQRKTLAYNSNDVAQISFSSKSIPGEWLIREVCILDKDGGRMTIERADIPNVNLYDLEITQV